MREGWFGLSKAEKFRSLRLIASSVLGPGIESGSRVLTRCRAMPALPSGKACQPVSAAVVQAVELGEPVLAEGRERVRSQAVGSAPGPAS